MARATFRKNDGNTFQLDSNSVGFNDVLMTINKAAFPQLIKMEDRWGGGLHSTGVSYLFLTQQPRV